MSSRYSWEAADARATREPSSRLCVRLLWGLLSAFSSVSFNTVTADVLGADLRLCDEDPPTIPALLNIINLSQVRNQHLLWRPA